MQHNLNKPVVFSGWRYEFEAGRDHVLGAILGAPVNPSADWKAWLPTPEYQAANGYEPNACVSYATLNAIETLLNHQGHKITRGWSDRFLAKASGTDPNAGATYRNVLDTLRKLGVPLEDKWPSDGIVSLNDFYAPIPPVLYKDARTDFSDVWTVKYEEVPIASIETMLQYSPILISVTAWFEENGIYTDKGIPNNHAVMCFKKVGDIYYVFDSYDNAIKKYRGLVQQAKRIWVGPTPEDRSALNTVIEWLKKNDWLAFFPKFWEYQQLPPPVEQVVEPPKPMTIPLPKEHLLNSMCKAIQEYEGWHPPSGKFPQGSRSFRNKNPGNIRRIQSARVIGYDKDGFARFKTYEDGLLTLKGMILNAARGNSKVYKDTDNLRAYFAKYAPDSDGNHSVNYSNYVAKVMGVDPVLWQLRELV